MTSEELLIELRNRFPGIDDPDTEMEGADTVDALVQWFIELGGVMIESIEDVGEQN